MKSDSAVRTRIELGGRRLRRLIVIGALLGGGALSGVASGFPHDSGPSGGAPGTPPTTTTATTPTTPTTTTPPPSGKGGPLTGRGMWIWYVADSSGGNLNSIITTAHTYGIGTLLIKSGDGTTVWSQFTPQLVSTLHAAGIKVCAWQYVYGSHPIFEAEVGAAAVQAGADCLLIDAESEYEGRYVQAQQYIVKLRQLIGASFPVGLAGFPYVDFHPAFPYSVFLGPGGAQYNVPQMYWADIGTTVDAVYQPPFSFNSPYGRPIEPLGEVAGNPPPRQVMRFRQLSRVYGSGGVSWWDWQESSARDWKAVGKLVGNLQSPPAATMPILSIRSEGGVYTGDLVVWAQEHLYKAGVSVKIDGSFGARTQRAVESFQQAHGLGVTGVIDPTTWKALLAYPPIAVTWTKRGATVPPTVSASSARSLVLPVPGSARLRARRDEIPTDLGAH